MASQLTEEEIAEARATMSRAVVILSDPRFLKDPVVSTLVDGINFRLGEKARRHDIKMMYVSKGLLSGTTGGANSNQEDSSKPAPQADISAGGKGKKKEKVREPALLPSKTLAKISNGNLEAISKKIGVKNAKFLSSNSDATLPKMRSFDVAWVDTSTRGLMRELVGQLDPTPYALEHPKAFVSFAPSFSLVDKGVFTEEEVLEIANALRAKVGQDAIERRPGKLTREPANSPQESE